MRRLAIVPCNQDWVRMPDDGDGRFCERCDLRVVDVATLDGEQLDALVNAARSDRVCVRVELDGGRPRTKLGLAAGLLVSALAGCASPTGSSAQPCEPEPGVWIEFLGDDSSTPTTGGRIAGRVHHSSTGAPIEGAVVVLQCTALDGPQERMTNADGLYKFDDLPPGDYTIQVLAGEANVSKITKLPADAKFRANFAIDPERGIEIILGGLKPGLGTSPSSTM